MKQNINWVKDNAAKLMIEDPKLSIDEAISLSFQDYNDFCNEMIEQRTDRSIKVKKLTGAAVLIAHS